MKQCSVCGKAKALDEFHKNSRAPDGRQAKCKACAIVMAQAWYAKNKQRVKERESTPEKRAAASERTRRCFIKRKYGLDQAEYERVLAVQARGCAICKDPLSSLRGVRGNRIDSANIDHCHKTGRIRGLLCNRCNRGLGLFRDSPRILRAAARYVEQTKLF